MKLVVMIEVENDAFKPACHEELARILKELAESLDRRTLPATLWDINGNIVGKTFWSNGRG